MVTSPPAALCRHCHAEPVNRPRGLGWKCYYAPGVRDLYPVTSKFVSAAVTGRDPTLTWPECRTCGQKIASTNGDYKRCTTCRRLEPYRSQFAARIKLYAERAARKEPLFRPGDPVYVPPTRAGVEWH